MTTTTLTRLATIAITIGALPACDTDPAEIETFEIDFRDDHKTTGEKYNTNFLEDDALPLNNMPFFAGGDPDTQLIEIRSEHCRDSGGQVVYGQFSTAGVGTDVPTTDNGKLLTIELADVTDPTFHCFIDGELWEDTYWEVSVNTQGQTVQTDLWLRDVASDEFLQPVYLWYVNYWRIDPLATRPVYRPTCDEDVDDSVDPALAFHAYLVPGLHVSETNGAFTLDTLFSSGYMACRSGAVGKSISWGYSPWTHDVQTHELATRMVRADYCGTGTSYTEVGTAIWVESTLVAQDSVSPDPLIYDVEAVWNIDTSSAACVTWPRLAANQVNAPGFGCPGAGALPECGVEHFNDPGALILTHAPL
ncbi:MAG: hypothetical protein H6712_12535 [Myxococcales bacterium]|nr:hypothetical protein [Myxococcales bacterium]MCB9714684.1 hypothetical protein [Myxococcales bacterium]